MKYLLVVQFIAVSDGELEFFQTLENNFEQELAGLAGIDGHDFGRGEFNIFALTDAPDACAGICRKLSANFGLQHRMRIADRMVEGEAFTLLWPPGLREFSVS